jgi:heme/copper-type cytochrome/quinol oxidase subunit 2
MRIQFNLFSLLLASSGAYAGITDSVRPLAQTTDELRLIIFWICAAISLVVFGTLIYATISHRKSGQLIDHSFHKKMGVELIWAFIPLIIFILLVAPSTRILLSH